MGEKGKRRVVLYDPGNIFSFLGGKRGSGRERGNKTNPPLSSFKEFFFGGGEVAACEIGVKALPLF